MTEEKITGDMLIGDVMRKYPATEKVFKKHFGKGCFTCPGADREDIEFGATMHNVDAEAVIEELNRVAARGEQPRGRHEKIRTHD